MLTRSPTSPPGATQQRALDAALDALDARWAATLPPHHRERPPAALEGLVDSIAAAAVYRLRGEDRG